MSEHERKVSETGNPPGGFDNELDVRNIARTAVGLAAVTVAAVIAMWFVMNGLAERLDRRPQETTALVAEGLKLTPPEPRLEANPDQSLDTIWGTDHAALHSYGWISKDDGIAHIPIDSAIDMVVNELGEN